MSFVGFTDLIDSSMKDTLGEGKLRAVSAACRHRGSVESSQEDMGVRTTPRF